MHTKMHTPMPRLLEDLNVSCATCFDQSLPPEYPPWRRDIAVAILTIHVALLTTVFVIAWLYRHHPRMRIRDRMLAVLMSLGAVGCMHIPIRELIGEQNYPCWAHYLCSMTVNILLIMTVMVRSLRLAAMHCMQARLRGMVRRRSLLMREIARKQAANTTGVKAAHATSLPDRDRDNMDAVVVSTTRATGALIALKGEVFARREARRTDVSGHDSDNNSNIYDGNNDNHPSIHGSMSGLSSEGTDEGCAEVDPCQAARTDSEEGRSVNGCISCWQFILIDVFRLHQGRGQLCMWLLLAMVHVVPTSLHWLRPGGPVMEGLYGCSITREEGFIKLMAIILFIIVEAGAAVYIYFRPDVFLLREELLILAITATLGVGITIVLQTVGGPTLAVLAPTYPMVFMSWVFLFCMFLLPALWKPAHEAKAAVAIAPAFQDFHIEETCSVECAPTQEDAITVHNADDLELGQLVDITVPFDGVDDVDAAALRHLCELVFPQFYNHEKMFVADDIKEHIRELPHKDRFVFQKRDFDLLTVLLCSSHSGRKCLEVVLAEEMGANSLLFLLETTRFWNDIVQIHRNSMKIDWPAFGAGHSGEYRLSSAQSGEFLQRLGEVLQHASRITATVLSDSIMAEWKLPLATTEHVQRHWCEFQSFWLQHLTSLQAKLDVTPPSPAAIFVVPAIQSQFIQLFYPLECIVFERISRGAAIRFTSKSEHAARYSKWRATVLEPLTTAMQPHAPLNHARSLQSPMPLVDITSNVRERHTTFEGSPTAQAADVVIGSP